MSSYRKKSDWGCLGWFLLAFLILALTLLVIVLASLPSGEGAGDCESAAHLDQPGRGNSTELVKRGEGTESVTYVSFPVKPGPAPQPVKPNPVKPGPAKPQKPPQGGSGGSTVVVPVPVDMDDCD